MNSRHPIIIVGDFNVHEREWLGSSHTSAAGAALREFSELCGLSQLVDRGTRRDAMLDLALSEYVYTGTVSYHPPFGTSDHIAIFVRYNVSSHLPPPPCFRRVYHWKSAPWHHIRGYFRRVQWDKLKFEPTSDAVDAFVKVLTEVRDRYVPSTIPTLKRPIIWWNRFCQCSYQKKLQAWFRCDWPAYHIHMLAAQRAQAIAHHHYQRSLINKLQSGTTDRTWWNLTKNISGLNKPYNRSAPDVDSLASYFASKLSLSADFDPASSAVPPANSNVTCKRSWRVKLSKVRSVLSSLDVKKAIGPDDVSPYILKHCSNELCYPVCMLFRRVCKTGQFPSSWKVSRITPVYKRRGSVTDPRFYRPIAVLPTLSMVFERVIYSQLYRHNSPYIPSTQFGFVRGTGAQDCGAALAFTAIQALERRQECRIVSLDIRGAFDSVWWGGLLQHLKSVGLRGKAYCLLSSYLCDRYLFVVAHGDTSSLQPFTAGVPQGGIWSPILFNLYIRDLPTQILHCALLQYADDSTLIKVVPSKEDRITVADEMNADLARIYSWGLLRNINFEPAKCHSLCVSLKRDTDLHPHLFMATLPIEEVDALKILGVYFDRRLTWGHMIDQLTIRCRQRLGALFRVREYLGQSGLIVAYKSFVRPVCEYGSVIFMGASAVHLHKLDAVQKAAERLCQVSFQPLSSRRKASAIGLLCKLLDSHCRRPLQNFCPTLVSVTHSRYLRYVSDDPLLLQNSIKYNSLDLFIRSFWVQSLLFGRSFL